MEDNKVLLSISLLVSGRKETKQCLDSLKPFMEQLPCELVLVDTGCDENTKSLLRQYTDKIIPFTWCADFSKARNAGLEQSIGKWFLYLDDDEWFDDPSEIIDFFKSGEYKNYHSACYMQRNYATYDETRYSDSIVSRMTENFKGVKFESSIHEYISPMKPPAKIFDTYVKHFGYIFNSQKEHYDHSKRNVELLIDMMKKEPMNFRWDTQTLQEYMGISEYSKMIEIANAGISKFHKIKNITWDNIRALGSMYGYLVEGYAHKFDYDDEEEAILAAFKEVKLTKLAQAYLYRCACLMNYQTERYEKSVKSMEKYMEIYNKISDNNDEKYKQGGLLVGDAFDKEKYQDVLLNGIMASVKCNRDDILDKYFFDLGWHDSLMLLHPDFQSIVIKRLVERPYSDLSVKMAMTMTNRQNNLSSVIVIIMQLESSYQKASVSDQNANQISTLSSLAEKYAQEEANKTYLNNLIDIFSQVETNHWFITYLKILKANRDGALDDIPALFNNLFTHVFDIFNLNEKIWNIAESANVQMEPFFLRIDFTTWRNGIVQWVDNTTFEDIDNKDRLVHKWQTTENIRYDFFYMKVSEAKLLHIDSESCSFENFEQLMLDFANSELSYHKRLYKESAFTEYPEALPCECQIAVGFAKAIATRQQTNGKETLDEIKPLIDVYPSMNPVIKIYISKFGEYLKKLEDEDPVNKEMNALAAKLKDSAMTFIHQGKYDSAMEILNQLKQHFPNDIEIDNMMHELKRSSICSLNSSDIL